MTAEYLGPHRSHGLLAVAKPGRCRPASTCEAHRSRQFHCHSRRFFLSGTPATATKSLLVPIVLWCYLPVEDGTKNTVNDHMVMYMRIQTIRQQPIIHM